MDAKVRAQNRAGQDRTGWHRIALGASEIEVLPVVLDGLLVLLELEVRVACTGHMHIHMHSIAQLKTIHILYSWSDLISDLI